MDRFDEVKTLLQGVFSAEPPFYREKYRAAGFDETALRDLTEESFKTLPFLAKEELASTPYRNRLYQEESGVNKLVPCVEAGRHFLIHRTLEEIKDDNLPCDGSRPMVLMSDMYEAIERCLFFYEKNILPLIGEFRNPAVVAASARQYNIDALVMDHAAIEQYREKLLALNLSIRSITVVDSALYQDDFSGWPETVKKYFVLSFPETGRIAYACLARSQHPSTQGVERKEHPVFILHPYPDILIEPGALAVVTSTRLKACPLIRYQTSCFFEPIASACGCGKESFAA